MSRTLAVNRRETRLAPRAPSAAVPPRRDRDGAAGRVEQPLEFAHHDQFFGRAAVFRQRPYQVVQPRIVLEFYRDLTEVSGYELETAGVLKEGRKF
jgi:hypothetical protein